MVTVSSGSTSAGPTVRSDTEKVGGAGGVAGGLGIAALLRLAVPGMPVYTPLRYIAAALFVSLITGLLSGVLPARRAASLDPVEALHTE